MFNFVSRISFVYIVILISTYSIPTSFVKKSSKREANTIGSRFKRSVNENVLWNTEPPTIVKELPVYVAFYSDEFLRLQCNIRGNPRPTYQWYVSISAVSLTIPYESFEKISSATEKTLMLDGPKTTESYSRYAYFCSAQNPLGILYSKKIIVERVTKPRLIDIQYQKDLIFPNEKFTAKCKLPQLLPPIFKFKHWEVRYNSGTIISLNKTSGRYSVIHSTKEPQLHIRNITNEELNDTKIRCVFQSTIDKSYDLDNKPFQSVEKFFYDDIPYLTKINCPGETITASVGSNVELPWCTSPRTLNVSWYKIVDSDIKNNVEIANDKDDKKFVMVSKRYGNLMIMNVTKEDSGKYFVRSQQASTEVVNRRLETTYTLNVQEIPSMSLTPKEIRKKVSESAEFFCEASFAKCQFRWLHNGRQVVNGYDDWNVEVVSQTNTSILKFKKLHISVSGVYQCIATSLDDITGTTAYSQISGTIQLTEVPPVLVKQSPRVEIGSMSANIQMSAKNYLKTIECTFAANPKPSIDLYHDYNKVTINNIFAMDIQRDQNSIYNFIVKLTIDLKEVGYGEDITKYAGEYQARATNSLGTASCNTYILMDGNPEVRLPLRQTAVGDKDYVITCFFKAMGVPEFFWERQVVNSETWESLPVNHRTNLLEKGHQLMIKTVIKNSDEGIYRCTIKYNGVEISGSTNLIVAYRPILKALPNKHDSSQGQTHICTVSSEPDKPWYAWWTFTKYNSNETIEILPDKEYSNRISPKIYSNKKSAMYSVYYKNEPPYNGKLLDGIPSFLIDYPNRGVDLSIKARSHDKDTFGKFVCHVRNHIGSDEKTIEDNYLRLEFKITPPSSSEVVVGDTLYLDCTAEESDLKPFVKWRISKHDTEYTDINKIEEYKNRIFQYDNGTLVMRNVKESDPSKMICFIIPTAHSDTVQSKISYIEIKVPARICRLEPEISKVAGKSFNLSCDVLGHTQNMMVSWRYRSQSIDAWTILYEASLYSKDQYLNKYEIESQKFIPITVKHNKTYSSVHLNYNEGDENMSGQYKCEARNKYNMESDQTTTKLTIISKPSMVHLVPKDQTSTSVSFDWTPPEKNGNRPILQYIIKYYEVPLNQIKGDYEKKTIQVNQSVHSFVVDHLRPFKKYEITVEAENEVGVSEPFRFQMMTQEAKPQKPVNNLVACSTKPDEILVSWDDPDLEYQNGHISNYQMCYQIIPSGRDSKTGIIFERLVWPDNNVDYSAFPHVKCNNTKMKSFTVSHLPQFTDFAIRVIAFNSKGASPPLYTKVRTLEDLPQAPPSLVTCIGQHQSIELTWNPPSRKTINGVLMGYAVYYYKPNKYSDESNMKSITVHGRTNVVIDHLKPYTSYSIQVMAVNRKGLGPPSGSIVCTTKEAKPEAPEMVKAVKINNTCSYISWLHTLNPNGHIREYCVTWFLDKFNTKCQHPDMSKRYNTMIICGAADAYREISNIKVYARNQYDGAYKDVISNDDSTGILSIGGDITVREGSSIILPCETPSVQYKDIRWKKDDQEIQSYDQKLKVLENSSLEVSNIDRNNRYIFRCISNSDSIEYNLIVEENNSGILKTPIIDDSRVTENSVFIRWKSQGTSDMAAPITGFTIIWQNLYNKVSKTVKFDDKARSFYLNNVTCASDFIIKVCSQNGNGQSKFSEPKKLRTLGSAPQIPDSTILLPEANVESHSANFNLMAFGPGENCSAMFFIIEIFITSMGSDADFIINKTVSIYELENKCCYKVTGLNPLTIYKYFITATNPAGITQSYNTFGTLGINGALPGLRQHGASTNSLAGQSWLLMIVLVIVIILVLIFVVVGVLYILRSKEKKAKPISAKVVPRKPDYNQNRIEKPCNHDDTTSIDSEPSPYAVYQPDADQKLGQMLSHQISQQSSTPQYNYPDHHYNQIRYDKIPGRHQIPLDDYRDNYRRANSAECLSSLGNASVTGIADLESPNNIETSNTQEYFRAPFNHCADTDEVFQNIRIQEFSTMNRKRLRRESENTNRYNDEENARLMNNRNRFYEPNNPRNQQRQQQMNPVSRNPNHHQTYCQQMSMPDPSAMYQSQHAYPSNRVRTSSGSGRTHPSSQTLQSNNPGSSAQVSSYGSYYGHRVNNIQPYSSSSGIRRDEPPRNLYSSYISGSNLSNYNPSQRTAVASRPAMESIDSPDEGIYTDRVIVV